MPKYDDSLRFIRSAPPLREEDLREINGLFASYLFRRRKTREVWCSACGRHFEVCGDSPVMLAAHSPEPRPDHRCHAGAMSAPPPRPETAECPLCGRESRVKELGRTGRRDNLAEYLNVMVLRWHEGALWAVGYRAYKTYGADLTAPPSADPMYFYRFAPGAAECDGLYCDFPHQILAERLREGRQLRQPFHGQGYNVVGLGEVEKSPFRWCGYERLRYKDVRFFALCTAYPRQVEMLMKAGLEELVTDFLDKGKRNCRVFDWEEPDPRRAFGLTRPELREFLAGPKDLDVLYAFKRMKKAGVPAGFPGLRKLRNEVGTIWFERLVTRLARYRVSLTRIGHYFTKQETGKKKPRRMDTAGWWCDYIDAAKVLGLNLKNEVFLLPRDLQAKHDEATKRAAALLDIRRKDADKQRERKRLGQLCRRYTYTDGAWLIRPPHGAEEIVAEGKALRHCVGGYADRHVKGTVTILFLRSKADPEKPRVTIEMRGNEIVQIHGWDDERTKCKENPRMKSPRKIYAEFLDRWLAWLEAGSRRDKLGRPVLPQAEGEVRTA